MSRLNQIPTFIENDVTSLLQKKEDFWIKAGEKAALKLFHEAAERVPAYKDFLHKNNLAAEKIKSYQDMQYVPPVNKKNYLLEYPLEALCWDGTMQDKALTFTATSGSTGNPFYFPRDEMLDWQASIMHEIFLKNTTQGKPVSTLVIDCFGMGIWIGGLITYQAFRKIALRGYPVTIVTPGSNKKEIFETINHLKDKFEQIILCGYPPFIKDVIQEGAINGTDWKKLNLKFIFAAEAFSEEFRDFMIKNTNIQNPYLDMTNIYGSADLGTMAMETPLSILVRKIALPNEALREDIFPSAKRTPTIAQFNPLFIQFESVENNILCTAYNALPLIRYSIGDHGKVVKFSEIENIFKKNGIDFKSQTKQTLGNDQDLLEWPFVCIYERADLSTKLYGAIIYPEHIREAIMDPSLETFLTGKFTLETKHDEEQNQYLAINIELKNGISEHASLNENTEKIIVDHLLVKNSEYYNVKLSTPERSRPRIKFSKYNDEHHFKPGIKHRWVTK